MKNIINTWVMVVFVLLTRPLGAVEQQVIHVKGSDTMFKLVTALAEVYQSKSPDRQVIVTGGGSEFGVEAVIAGQCEIANVSRVMKTHEVAEVMSRGLSLSRIVIAMDGLVVIVNERNPVEKMTIEELRQIYEGEIENWQQIGGRDLPVSLYSRNDMSGTFGFFTEEVRIDGYAPSLQKLSSTEEIVKEVKNDEAGIGYVGIGYARDIPGIKMIKLAESRDSAYVSPTERQAVKDGGYPLARPLNQYIYSQVSEAIKDFITFELSDEGQKIVEEQGFFPVSQEYVIYNNDLLPERP
jgi:phosphate transport system substrate-binding protein